MSPKTQSTSQAKISGPPTQIPTTRMVPALTKKGKKKVAKSKKSTPSTPLIQTTPVTQAPESEA